MDVRPITFNNGLVLPLFDYGAAIKLEKNYTGQYIEQI